MKGKLFFALVAYLLSFDRFLFNDWEFITFNNRWLLLGNRNNLLNMVANLRKIIIEGHEGLTIRIHSDKLISNITSCPVYCSLLD